MRIFIEITVAIYFVASFLAFLAGSFSANKGNYFFGPEDYCMKRPSRAESLFPSYKLGCYMFGQSNKPYYYEEQNE